MKKLPIAVLGIYAALFTLGLLGCDNASSSSDNKGGLFAPEDRGELEITIDPSLYGSSVYICSSGSEINPASSPSASSVANASGMIVLNSAAGSRWNGTGNFYVYLVKNSIVAAIGQTTFSNGTGTISSFTPAGLTLTGVNSSLYGSSVYICSSSSETPWSDYSASSTIPNNSSSRISLNKDGSRWNVTGSFYVYLVNGSNQTVARPIYFLNGSASINLSNVTLSSSSN